MKKTAQYLFAPLTGIMLGFGIANHIFYMSEQESYDNAIMKIKKSSDIILSFRPSDIGLDYESFQEKYDMTYLQFIDRQARNNDVQIEKLKKTKNELCYLGALFRVIKR